MAAAYMVATELQIVIDPKITKVDMDGRVTLQARLIGFDLDGNRSNISFSKGQSDMGKAINLTFQHHRLIHTMRRYENRYHGACLYSGDSVQRNLLITRQK